MIDVSLVLNLHKEAKFLPRTLLSLKEAADYARVHGIIVELVVVLDRPDVATKHVLSKFDLSVFDYSQVVEIDCGSLGLARNDGIALTRGKYIRLCDGDDLISFNLIAVSFFEAERLGPKAILLSEWLFAFGIRYYSVQYFDLDVVTPMAMIDIHPYVSQIFFSRSLSEALQFEDLRLTFGYAYEDWHFATEAVALGYSFHVSRNTSFFYRQRAGSLLTQADGISVQQISPSKLFVPSVFTRICADGYRQFLNGEVRRDAGDARAFIAGPTGRHQFWAANQIEPAIYPKLIEDGSCQWHVTQASNLSIGRRYFEICQELGDRAYKDIFIVNSFGAGGAEKYLAKIITEFCSLCEDPAILVVMGEPHPNNEWLERLPPCVNAIDLSPYLDEIGDKGIDLITLKLIQSLGPNARLHFRQSHFGERFFARYGRALKANKRIFYRFGQETRFEHDGVYHLPWFFQFLSEQIDHIDLLVSDGRKVIEFDQRRLGVTPEKWHFLPTLYEAPIGRETACSRSKRDSNRILWASRLAEQKRPEVLLAIARKALTRCPEIIFDVFGNPTPEFDAAQFDAISNIHYHGGFSFFAEIADGSHLCVAYTSAYDGMPNIVLEAAGMGLPIIAPDVGAVDEFVENDRTGILLPNEADADIMAEAYVDAILRLKNDLELRANLAKNAYDRAVLEYGAAPFRKKLSEILEVALV